MEVIKTEGAPEPIGPYSQGILAKNIIFTSGQIHPEGSIEMQTAKVLEYIDNILAAKECDMSQIAKVNVYLKDLGDFKAMNDVYERQMPHKPARACVQVARLPKDALVEIDVIAVSK